MIFRVKKNFILLAAFILILFLPLLDNVFNFSPIKELFEKRLANPLPKRPHDISSFVEYPKNFENFFNDHYGFRKSLITLNGKIMDNVFNESPSSQALIGKDGWLYFNGENTLLDLQGLAKLDEKKLEKMAQSFVENWHKMRAQNIDYLLVIAAAKTSIYPEFLPDFIKVSNENRRIDKFILAIKKIDENFPLLDLRMALIAGKKNEIIFHKTDTHWNKRGAYIGYVEIMKKLHKKYMPRNHFDEVEGVFDGDIAGIMGIKANNIDYNLQEKYLPNFHALTLSKQEYQAFHKIVAFENDAKNLPILFVYKDSFFDNMLDLFAHHFSYSYFVNEFPCDLNLEIIKKHKANVVIQEFWEGRVEEVMNKCKL